MNQRKLLKILEIAGSGTIGSSQMGPVSSDIYYLSKSFKELGHEVSIYDAKAKYPRDINENLNIIESPNILREIKSCSFIPGYFHNLYREYKFIKYLKNLNIIYKYDIIHSHECTTAFIIKLFFKNSNKLVYTSHTPIWLSPIYKPNVKRKIFNIIGRLLKENDKSILESYQKSIVLGKYLKNYLKKGNICVIPNGLDYEKLIPIDHQLARKRKPYKSGNFFNYNSGTNSPIKGIDILIKAIKNINKVHKNIKVNIIGSFSGSFTGNDSISKYSQEILNQAKGLPINFKGFISNRTYEFNSLLAASDIFVLPSYFDNQPNTILEAFYHKIPVIGSNVGGVPDMVIDGTGFLFECGNAKELSELLIKVINNKEILNKMKNICYNHVIENYQWKDISKKHIEFFEE